jgi:PPOX class probable F420-dependent enzyme
MNEPRAKRLTSPGYGFENVESPGAALPWEQVSKLLSEARNYWLVTATKDGRPHAAPVWAIWDDGRLLFSTSRNSRKGINIERNPRVVVHLDHEPAAVILDGIAERVTDEAVIDRFAKAVDEKYDWDGDMNALLADPTNGVYVVHPHIAFSYEENLGETATRWEFPN